jgi:hypothetical protein
MIEPQASSDFAGQSILVTGVARDCEKTVRNEVLRLFESLKMGKALHWLVIESDSSDKTVDALRGLENEIPGFRFRSLGSLREEMPVRTQRIAHCRNVYLEELRSNPLYSQVDLVVVADLDGVNSLVTAEGFRSCCTRSDWAVCTANQRGPYYDIWALRHPLWSPNDCWQQYEFLLAKGANREIALWTAMYAKMVTIDENADWIEVESAFGGLAVYRRHVLDEISYSGFDETGNPICEHVSLNNQIRSKGHRVFINPRLINTAHTDQAHQRSLPECLKRLFLDLRHKTKKNVLNALRRSYCLLP